MPLQFFVLVALNLNNSNIFIEFVLGMTEDEIKEATRAALAAKPVVISLKKKSEVITLKMYSTYNILKIFTSDPTNSAFPIHMRY